MGTQLVGRLATRCKIFAFVELSYPVSGFFSGFSLGSVFAEKIEFS